MEQLQPDFKTYLQEELIKRCKQDPKYSLRAFARSLELEPSALSKILRGKRALTEAMFRNLAHRLGLSPDRMSMYENSLASSSSGDLFQQQEYLQRSLDAYQVIADWIHFAILELCGTQGFKTDPKWIAAKLGVTIVEVMTAVERLKRLDLLDAPPEGPWSKKPLEKNSLNTDLADTAIRRSQKTVLEKAIRALDDVPLDRRYNQTVTLAIQTAMLPLFKQKLKELKDEITRDCAASETKDAVYHLCINLAPATVT